ncbi:MAG: hypothetical protein KKA60_09065 [Proteobacteria bacterium]|nr:hypothetical protein [Pseudomonadota bacterium]
MNKTVPWIALALAAVLALSWAVLHFRASEKRAANQVLELQLQNLVLENGLDGLAERLGRCQSLLASGPRPAGLPALSPEERERLEAAGLSDPARDLAVDLMAHPELIPMEGVVGGRMGFYDPAAIFVLNQRWVYAACNDGHIRAHLLLSYDLSPSGEISWKVLDGFPEPGE